MPVRIKLVVDEYKGYIKSLKNKADSELLSKPAGSIDGDIPSWVKYIDGCKTLLDAMDLYAAMLIANTQDFENSTDILIKEDELLSG